MPDASLLWRAAGLQQLDGWRSSARKECAVKRLAREQRQQARNDWQRHLQKRRPARRSSCENARLEPANGVKLLKEAESGTTTRQNVVKRCSDNNGVALLGKVVFEFSCIREQDFQRCAPSPNEPRRIRRHRSLRKLLPRIV